jgi:hypothetical protein
LEQIQAVVIQVLALIRVEQILVEQTQETQEQILVLTLVV